MSVTFETKIDRFRLGNLSGAAEHRVCSACQSVDVDKAFDKKHDWLLRCKNCGLMWASPQPTDAELAEIYGPNYYGSFGYDEHHFDAYCKMKRTQAEMLLNKIPEPTCRKPRLLDVGSALADLLLVAEMRGYDAFGIDTNAYAVEAAESVLPGKTQCESLDSYDSASNRFDVIVCLEVIEHLRDPIVALKKMFDLLRPGGTLLLTTPDTGSWRARKMGWRWYHIHCDHMWYFNQANLNSMARDSGFEILSHEPAIKRFTLRYVLSVLTNCPNSRLVQVLAKIVGPTLPRFLGSMLMPAISEGQLIVARRPKAA